MQRPSAEVAPFNVTINNMLPERFDTDRQKFMVKMAMEFKGLTKEEAIAEINESIAAKRMGIPSEFGDACAFCAARRPDLFRSKFTARWWLLRGLDLGDSMLKKLIAGLVLIAGCFIGVSYYVSIPVVDGMHEDQSVVIADPSQALTFARTDTALILVTAHEGDSLRGINLTAIHGAMLPKIYLVSLRWSTHHRSRRRTPRLILFRLTS